MFCNIYLIFSSCCAPSLTFWNDGEPDNRSKDGAGSADCGRMGRKREYENLKSWFDISCNYPHKSICEKTAGLSSCVCVWRSVQSVNRSEFSFKKLQWCWFYEDTVMKILHFQTCWNNQTFNIQSYSCLICSHIHILVWMQNVLWKVWNYVTCKYLIMIRNVFLTCYTFCPIQ